MRKESLATAKKCLKFTDESVSCFHAVKNVEDRLKENGFIRLKENKSWELKPGKSYYVKRNDSSLIAFRIPKGEPKGFHIAASHSDSPTFKLKPKSGVNVENHYVKLNVEPYGGMIYATWLDRCLSVAGRVIYRRDDKLKSRTVNIDEDLLVIPNLAIHIDREMNKNLSYNPQIDLQPLLGAWQEDAQEAERKVTSEKTAQDGEALSGETPQEREALEKAEDKESGILMEKLACAAGIEKEEILGSDLFLYVRDKGKLAGAQKELMIAPRLDDLVCVFASVEAILAAEPKDMISVCAVFDNEEVGSCTKQGAASTFLENVLSRIGEAMGKTGGAYLQLLAESFMISADNAHGVHPNHPEKADSTCRPYLNKGIVIKYHGGQKYTTDAWSEAVIKELCRKAEVPYQVYCNRSDIPGGSTLGNISAGQVSIPAADIGIAQLAMHSAVETAGSMDVEYLLRVLAQFYGE